MVKLESHQEQLPATTYTEDELSYEEINKFKSLEIPSKTKAVTNLIFKKICDLVFKALN